jgi:hypothetical protein
MTVPSIKFCECPYQIAAIECNSIKGGNALRLFDDAIAMVIHADHDRAHIHEFAQPEMGELATEPRMLDASERKSRIGMHDVVDEDETGVQLVRDAFGAGDVACPHVGAESEA